MTGEKLYTQTLTDTLGLKIGISENDSEIFLLTDSAFMSFDRELEPIASAHYNRNNAKFFKQLKDCFIIAESNNLSGSSMILTAYDYSAQKMFELETEKKVIDAVFTDSTLYVLFKDSMSVYDYGTDGENGLYELVEVSLDKQYKAIRTDDYGRYILVEAKSANRGALFALLQTQLKENSKDS